MTDRTSGLLELIKQYRYPACSKGTVHDFLNMLCVDERCEFSNQLEALCSMCIDNNCHRQPYHAHKNLKKFLRDLLQLADSNDKRSYDQQEDDVERRFRIIAKEYQILGDNCFEIAKNILASLDYYKNARAAVPHESQAVRKIIEDICIKENERNLQANLTSLRKFVEIRNGMLKMTSKSTREYRMDLERKADNFILELEDTLNRIPKRQIESMAGGPGMTKMIIDVETMKKQIEAKEREMIEDKRREDLLDRNDYLEKSYNRSLWENELKRISLKIEAVKRAAVEEANRKGDHGVRDYWKDWDELVTNARAGWGIDGKHSTYPQTSPMFCYKCFPIYHEHLKTVEALKKEYAIVEDKLIRTMYN